LLIFDSDEERVEFFGRLSEAWRAQIRPPSAQGYTVHDIATATYKKELGVHRPVYLHEAVHAIVARDLRLLPGHGPTGALQEGIANYFQLRAYPTSIDPGPYLKALRQPVDGKGLCRRLEPLVAGGVPRMDHAALAT